MKFKINWKNVLMVVFVILGKIAASILSKEKARKEAEKYVKDYILELSEQNKNSEPNRNKE